MAGRSADILAGAVLVTANPGKLDEARRLCGRRLDWSPVDLPEIQSLDLKAVLRAKASAAWDAVGRPLLVEETGLELAALNGFPGPLVKWMLAAVGASGIARVALALGDASAAARCALLYFDGEHQWIAEGSTPGELVLPARGDRGFGWDPVFQPEGESRTYAEMEPAEKDRVSHRAAAWRRLVVLLETV